MAKAWVYQDPKQVKKHGADKASWYVGWIDPDGNRKGKSCGPGLEGERNAEKLRKRIESELATGTYKADCRVTWDEFKKQYDERILGGLEPRSRDASLESLAAFKRIINPKLIKSIKTATIDDFVAARRKDPGKKKGTTVSPATINKDLRHIKAAMNKAVEWEMLDKVPKFHMERQVKRIPRFVTPDHFTAIYQHCDAATMPKDLPYPAGDWWRALITFAYMTGWRIGDLLTLRRDDLDLQAGTAITAGDDNKGDRDACVKLHDVVLEHLATVPSFDLMVFPWPHDRRTLDVQFDRIQAAAGIHLHCRGRHEHTPACHVYGFHDLRRAFATLNAPTLTPDALQALMRHKSYLTTQVYINTAKQVDDAVKNLHVPEVLRKKAE